MKTLSRPEIAIKMKESGLVPLFYNKDYALVEKVLLAAYKGGARFFEFTHRGELAHEVFTSLVKFSRKQCPEMILGVGSVVDAGTASLYMNLGAEFVVSPVIREDVARICNRRKVLYLPGCGSLTEISQAEELGCEIVKLFPAAVLGPGFVKAVKGPQPWTSIMPSGGVTLEEQNIKAWFDAGVTCVGMGSALIPKNMLENSDYKSIENNVAKVLKIISETRSA
ncbi:bifunctional 4-hydroxy-2-oxoglutarate aldolase/2-dehydro-3-deoxy-phosphogluconate aldolase [Salegentibacter salegens]|uniref:2-dehydro-3-deoxyphosphogluconate aldolase / (4S)-4-hydroxy-2-oxoglutarate aldolase n=1 Tax=Salegentibacter salegens TaxID=143223 RepID=A0A1M7N5X7_9FLAO|nr:bifunctional 4-hydroxy-2-oxoglutarate aldolase/2-dehydro-3-deoxy-phosphogluconate aldolase [Salegentibacter salegens]PRX46874.1 2-dehydro-3-deoxyphosphogluconate aldolase/(4S)-4-hydroxy-2-oxoglutarate aldolase [Salegentibacter salegens]SHM98913.1 2-dehydro-3-deoxyphosphogluconate aldolase / (4S)-4-hydroxy-2-oxoglutarate aldolase [Salegentibacter salegens]